MLKTVKIRTAVLFTHGFLAFGLGLALFYLRATMTNFIFEAFAVMAAILLSAGALILAGMADWFAAASEGVKHIHRLAFYLLAGVAFVFAGVLLGYFPQITIRSLVLLAALHALVFGIAAFSFAFKAAHTPIQFRALCLLGALSVAFSGAVFGFGKSLDEDASTVLLALYMCFIGVKMLYFAWDAHQSTSLVERLWASTSTPATPSIKHRA